MKYGSWAENAYAELAHSPLYLTERLMIEITEQFYLRMKDLGISQYELANRIGKKQPYISKIMSGEANPTLKTLVTIADALGTEFSIPRLIEKDHVKNYDVLSTQYHSIIQRRAIARFHDSTYTDRNIPVQEKNNEQVALAG